MYVVGGETRCSSPPPLVNTHLPPPHPSSHPFIGGRERVSPPLPPPNPDGRRGSSPPPLLLRRKKKGRKFPNCRDGRRRREGGREGRRLVSDRDERAPLFPTGQGSPLPFYPFILSGVKRTEEGKREGGKEASARAREEEEEEEVLKRRRRREGNVTEFAAFCLRK